MLVQWHPNHEDNFGFITDIIFVPDGDGDDWLNVHLVQTDKLGTLDISACDGYAPKIGDRVFLCLDNENGGWYFLKDGDIRITSMSYT